MGDEKEMESLLARTARKPDEASLAGFPARVRGAHEARRRPWVSWRDLGFALSGATAALAIMLARPAPSESAPLAAFEEREIDLLSAEGPAAPLGVSDALENLEGSELYALEAYLDQESDG